MEQKFDVLISGAGPVGLLITYQLARLGISTCIIDVSLLNKTMKISGSLRIFVKHILAIAKQMYSRQTKRLRTFVSGF